MTALYHVTYRSNVYILYYKDLCLGNTCDITNNISVVTLNFVKPAKVMLLENGLQCNVFGMKRMLYVTVV